MKKGKNLFLFFMCAFAFILLTSEDGCGSKEQQSSSGVGQSDVFHYQVNAAGRTGEQQNIYERQEVTSDFTKIFWINIFTLDGKILYRSPVRMKVTSSGKRLEPVVAAGNVGGYPEASSDGIFETSEFIQPDGTYGSSDEYIFWFDPLGRYFQLGKNYLLTDFPIDLSNPVDEITGLYNMNLKAHEWQKVEEEKLRDKFDKEKAEAEKNKPKDPIENTESK